MVVFICEGCQDSFNRPKVRNHLERGRCQGAHVSCLDCGKHFDGVTVEQHISCVSEQEKYTGHAKKNKFAGYVEEALASLQGPAKGWLELAINKVGIESLPKRKPKFVNLCKNIRGTNGVDLETIDVIWAAIDTARQASIEAAKSTATHSASTSQENDHQSKKLKTSLGDDDQPRENQEQSAEPAVSDEAKSARKALKKILKKATDHKMSFEVVQEKINLDKKGLKALIKENPDKFTRLKESSEVQLVLS